jgi:hypothetical protein
MRSNGVLATALQIEIDYGGRCGREDGGFAC